MSKPLCTITLLEDGSCVMKRTGEKPVTLTSTQALDIGEMIRPHIREQNHRSWLRERLKGCAWCATYYLRSAQEDNTSERVTLFLDIDGVLSIPNHGFPLEMLAGKDAWPISNTNRLLQVLDQNERISPVWMTHWGDDAIVWNDRAGTKHWPVAYPLSAQQCNEAQRLFPTLDDKSLAVAYTLFVQLSGSAIWVQDGFPADAHHLGDVQLLDTTRDPVRSLLFSRDDSAVNDFLALLVESEVAA